MVVFFWWRHCSHVTLPRELAAAKLVGKKERLLTETEWRNIGVVQSHGWEHYMIHAPEPHILLFKREKNYLEKYGNRPRPTLNELDQNAMQQ